MLPHLPLSVSFSPLISSVMRAEHATILIARPDQIASLDIYVELNFGYRKPPLIAGDEVGMIESLVSTILVGALDSVAAITRTSSTVPVKMIVLQGGAGCGKSLFSWRIMQYWDHLTEEEQQKARMPILINMAVIHEQVCKAAMERNRDFLLQQVH